MKTVLSSRAIAAAGLALGLFGLASAAQAHTDVSLSFGLGGIAPVYVQPAPVYAPPVYADPQPVYVAPPVRVYERPAYVYGDNWRRDEWRREQWRRHEWREHHEWQRRHRDWD